MNLAEEIENLDRCLTAPELARFMSVHPATAYRWAINGTIPSFRVGSVVRFDCRAVATFLRSNYEQHN